jgi:protein translocase SecG subunit
MLVFLIGIFSLALLLLCFFVVLIVLMQKPSANSGMGAALGGGAAEQVFGGEAGNVLTKTTVYAIIVFFVISFGLYLGMIYRYGLSGEELEGMETLRQLRALEQQEVEEDGTPTGPVRLGAEDIEVETEEAEEGMDQAPPEEGLPGNGNPSGEEEIQSGI